MTNRPASCEAIHQSDQMCCYKCGLVWDLDDDDPPECMTDEHYQPLIDVGRATLDELKREL